MQAYVHVLGPVGDAVIMRLEVRLKQLVGIDTVFAERLDHLVRAKVGQGRVVDLQVAQPVVVERLELLAVGLGHVGEEVGVAPVGLGAVALPGGQTEVEVAGRRHGELALSDLVGRNGGLEQAPVVQVGAPVVADLGLADGGHGVLLAGLFEGGDGRRGQAGEVPGHGADLAEARQLLEEAREVVLAVELARRQGPDAVGLLLAHNVIDGGSLSLEKFLRRCLALVGLGLYGGERLGADEGADVVGMERELHDANGHSW